MHFSRGRVALLNLRFYYSMLLRNRRPLKWRVSHEILEKSSESSADKMWEACMFLDRTLKKTRTLLFPWVGGGGPKLAMTWSSWMSAAFLPSGMRCRIQHLAFFLPLPIDSDTPAVVTFRTLPYTMSPTSRFLRGLNGLSASSRSVTNMQCLSSDSCAPPCGDTHLCMLLICRHEDYKKEHLGVDIKQQVINLDTYEAAGSHKKSQAQSLEIHYRGKEHAQEGSLQSQTRCILIIPNSFSRATVHACLKTCFLWISRLKLYTQNTPTEHTKFALHMVCNPDVLLWHSQSKHQRLKLHSFMVLFLWPR